MIEVRNRQRGPIQLVVKSRLAPRSFTTLVLPGVGGEKNTCLLPDELHTEYIDRLASENLISVRHIPNTLREGE